MEQKKFNELRRFLEFVWLDIIRKPNQTLFYAPACILLLILKYFSGLFKKWDDKFRNPAHTPVNKIFAVVSRRCI